MASKKTKARVDVREKILCEATRHFGERGFGGVALRDIAKGCGIPLSTLSSHFARKQNLQDAVFQRAMEVFSRRALTSTLAIGSPKQRFRQWLTNVVELFLSDLPEMKVLDREFQELDKPLTFNRVVRTSRERPAMDSRLFIAELAKETKSDILKSIPAVQLTQIVFAAIYGIVKLRTVARHVIGGKPVSKATLTRDIIFMFERMLRI